jgi:hypothetical protein
VNPNEIRQLPANDDPIELPLVRRLGVSASVLGMCAGAFEIAVGTSKWAGNKNDPTALGFVTIALAAIIGLAASASVRTRWASGVVAIGSVIVLAAVVGLTTAGLAWVPAALFAFPAGGIALGHAQRAGSLATTLQQHWTVVLLSALAVIDLAFAALSRSMLGVLGVIASGSIAAAMFLGSRSRRSALLVLIIGTVPFAVAAFWTVVVPLTTALVLVIGLPFVGRNHRRFRVP